MVPTHRKLKPSPYEDLSGAVYLAKFQSVAPFLRKMRQAKLPGSRADTFADETVTRSRGLYLVKPSLDRRGNYPIKKNNARLKITKHNDSIPSSLRIGTT